MSIRTVTATGLTVEDLRRVRARQRAAATDAKGLLLVLRAGLDALDEAEKPKKPKKKAPKVVLDAPKLTTLED